MKTRLSVKNSVKSKPQAAGTKLREECREPPNSGSKEEEKKSVKNYFRPMLEKRESLSESAEARRVRRLLKRKENRLKRRATETEEEKLRRRRLKAAYEKNQLLNETPEEKLTRLLKRRNKYRDKQEKLGKKNSEIY